MAVIGVTRSEGLCRVILSRPEKLNALSEEVRIELQRTFSDLADDVDCRVVLLEGAGRSFSAGADLTPELHSGPPEEASWTTRRHAAGAWQRLLDLIETVPQVTVAKLHGHVIGGAVLLAAACDIRIASDDVRIRIPEVALGIPLTWGGIPRLVREVGLPMARYLVMTGRTLPGEQALRCGFAQELVPHAEFELRTTALVEDLLAMPAGALAMTRSATAAIGRAMLGSCGWGDPDILGWSLRDPEALDALAKNLSRRAAERES